MNNDVSRSAPDAPARAVRPALATNQKQMFKLPAEATESDARQQARYDAREVQWDHSRLKGARFCGRHSAHKASVKRGKGAAGKLWSHFSGLMTCGLIWACPVCGPKIKNKRAQELDRIQQAWTALHPNGSVMLLTMTLPHGHGDRLSKLMDLIAKGFRRTMYGGAWMKAKRDFGLVHYARAWDATYTVEGAWHPHLHAVLYSTRKLSDAEVTALEGRFHHQWSRAIVAHGHKAPNREHGCKLEIARNARDVSRYLAKATGADRPSNLAMELTRGDLKKSRNGKQPSRTPWQILEDVARTGDCDDLALWNEWETATKGRRFMVWSRGLRALASVEERSDEELAAEEADPAETVWTFSRDQWDAVTRTRKAQGHILWLARQDNATEEVAAYTFTITAQYQTTDEYKKKEAARKRKEAERLAAQRADAALPYPGEVAWTLYT